MSDRFHKFFYNDDDDSNSNKMMMMMIIIIIVTVTIVRMMMMIIIVSSVITNDSNMFPVQILGGYLDRCFLHLNNLDNLFQVCHLVWDAMLKLWVCFCRFGEWSERVVEQLDKDKQTVVLCHHGVRSQRMAQYLVDQGFQRVANVSGGIDAYSRLVDTSIPLYWDIMKVDI